MAGPLNAKVILARCSKTRKTFGIRIEQRNGDWVRTWAFPIDEHKAKREGFDAGTVSGSLKAVSGYPGCPHCGCKGFSHDTSCGKVNCSGGEIDNGDGTWNLTCAWCGKTAAYSAVDNLEVSSGGY